MLTLILNNIRTIGVIAAIIAVFGAGWYVRGQKAEYDQIQALQAQQVVLMEQCNADKQLTSKIGAEYETKISTLSNRVASLKRLQSTKCVSVTSPTRIADGNATTGLLNVDAVDSTQLIDLAAEAEKQRQQLISLQDFVKRIVAK